jgi:hypothetical protein
MRNWRQWVATSSAALFMGAVNFNNVARKPEFQTLPTIDILQLIVTGMCLGAVIGLTAIFLRGPRSS